jgi:hypothetical protein
MRDCFDLLWLSLPELHSLSAVEWLSANAAWLRFKDTNVQAAMSRT